MLAIRSCTPEKRVHDYKEWLQANMERVERRKPKKEQKAGMASSGRLFLDLEEIGQLLVAVSVGVLYNPFGVLNGFPARRLR